MFRMIRSRFWAILLMLPLISWAAPTPYDTRGIQFDHISWDEALLKARQTNRLIFVDAYASWCGPCRYMSANVFTDPAVADYYNAHFVNLKIDMESASGEEFGKDYTVSAYPTFFFINSDGKVVHHITGGMKAAEFVQLGKDAENPEKQSSTMEQRLRSDINSATGLMAYLSYLEDNNMPTDSLVEAYFGGLPQADWMRVSNWLLINKYIQNPNSSVIQQIEANRVAFNEGVSKELVDKKLRSVIVDRLESILKADLVDAMAYTSMRDRLLQIVDSSEVTRIRYYLEYAYFSAKHDSVSAITETIRFVEQSDPTSELYTKYARLFQDDFPGSQQAQAKALEWAQKAVGLGETYETLSIYARLLHQAKQDKEALSIAKKARQVAVQDGDSDTEMKELVAKLEPKKAPARKQSAKTRAKRV